MMMLELSGERLAIGIWAVKKLFNDNWPIRAREDREMTHD
jgi:hypothetical protein